ncbi:hypothetical protein F4778DRAFT_690900 [Xylariomycetidae sp. FL2044]|nr:hypothetical protein F4778DRAFT_690900 [Xylariomycetidae sp. FL2044]
MKVSIIAVAMAAGLVAADLPYNMPQGRDAGGPAVATNTLVTSTRSHHPHPHGTGTRSHHPRPHGTGASKPHGTGVPKPHHKECQKNEECKDEKCPEPDHVRVEAFERVCELPPHHEFKPAPTGTGAKHHKQEGRDHPKPVGGPVIKKKHCRCKPVKKEGAPAGKHHDKPQ